MPNKFIPLQGATNRFVRHMILMADFGILIKRYSSFIGGHVDPWAEFIRCIVGRLSLTEAEQIAFKIRFSKVSKDFFNPTDKTDGMNWKEGLDELKKACESGLTLIDDIPLSEIPSVASFRQRLRDALKKYCNLYDQNLLTNNMRGKKVNSLELAQDVSEKLSSDYQKWCIEIKAFEPESEDKSSQLIQHLRSLAQSAIPSETEFQNSVVHLQVPQAYVISVDRQEIQEWCVDRLYHMQPIFRNSEIIAIEASATEYKRDFDNILRSIGSFLGLSTVDQQQVIRAICEKLKDRSIALVLYGIESTRGPVRQYIFQFWKAVISEINKSSMGCSKNSLLLFLTKDVNANIPQESECITYLSPLEQIEGGHINAWLLDQKVQSLFDLRQNPLNNIKKILIDDFDSIFSLFCEINFLVTGNDRDLQNLKWSLVK